MPSLDYLRPLTARTPSVDRVHTLSFDSYCMYIRLSARREVRVPLALVPRLDAATQAQRNHWVVVDDGRALRWPALLLEVTLSSLLEAIDRRPSTLHAPEVGAARAVLAHTLPRHEQVDG